jgi:rare lipoprotein A
MSFSEKIHVRFTITSLLYCCAVIVLIGCTASPRFVSARNQGRRTVIGEKTTLGPAIEEGLASYYADKYNGQQTSNGEVYDMYALTAAHPTHPFNTKVKVTNLDNGRSVVLRINDRGPFLKDRIIDVSYTAAKQLQMIGTGTAQVRIEVIEWGPQEVKVK